MPWKSCIPTEEQHSLTYRYTDPTFHEDTPHMERLPFSRTPNPGPNPIPKSPNPQIPAGKGSWENGRALPVSPHPIIPFPVQHSRRSRIPLSFQEPLQMEGIRRNSNQDLIAEHSLSLINIPRKNPPAALSEHPERSGSIPIPAPSAPSASRILRNDPKFPANPHFPWQNPGRIKARMPFATCSKGILGNPGISSPAIPAGAALDAPQREELINSRGLFYLEPD